MLTRYIKHDMLSKCHRSLYHCFLFITSRKATFALLFLILLCTCAPPPPENDGMDALSEPIVELERPNILWITCEDISPMLAMFGDSTARTPNLDRLAARGVRFPNTFSVAGVCAPSRHAITTGMYPISTGGHNMRTQYNEEGLRDLGLPGAYGALTPPEVKQMSQVLRENGYFCTNNDKTDYQFEALKTAWDELGTRAHWRHRDSAEQPFFAIFNLGITHESQTWLISERNLRFRPGFENDTSTIATRNDRLRGDERPPLTVEPDSLTPPPYLVNDSVTRTDLARVYSNIEIMDQQVGLLLRQLDEDGLTDETIIFFYSDHGGPLPRQKRLLYDSGLRVPMVVSWPDGRRGGQVDERLISFVDLAPTTFSLAGIDLPDYLQGRPVLGPAAAEVEAREYVFAASDRLDGFYDRIRACSDGRYKYLRNYYPERGYYLPVVYREQMGAMQSLLANRMAGQLNDAQAQWFRKRKPPEELFDTETDPHELINLADLPEHAERLARMREATDEWLARVGDLGDVPEVELVSRFWNGRDEMPPTAAPRATRNEAGNWTLSSDTPGAQIAYRYVAPGGEAERWRVYAGPLPARPGARLEATAQRIGYRESEAVVITADSE